MADATATASQGVEPEEAVGGGGSDLVGKLARELDAVDVFLLDLRVDLLLDALQKFQEDRLVLGDRLADGYRIHIRFRAVGGNREHRLVRILENWLKRRIADHKIRAPREQFVDGGLAAAGHA